MTEADPCTPRDLNPEPTDYGRELVDERFWRIVEREAVHA